MNDDEFHARIKELYHPPTNQFTLIDVPDIRYLAIDGSGDPKQSGIEHSMQWLWSIVHFLLPIAKEQLGRQFAFPPLECLFWADDNEDLVSCSRDKWQWRVMVVISSWATKEIMDTAVARAEEKRGNKSPHTLRVDNLHEGKSVQIMHIGDYGQVQGVCEKLYGQLEVAPFVWTAKPGSISGSKPVV
jgi:hypothetical protein